MKIIITENQHKNLVENISKREKLIDTLIELVKNTTLIKDNLIISVYYIHKYLVEELHIPESLYIDVLKKYVLSLKKVETNILLNYSPVTHLPDGLDVDGDLELAKSKIMYLPDNLKVTGHLNLNLTDIEYLPKGLVVGKDLKLESAQKLKSLPPDLKVGGDLIIFNSGITEVPDTVEVGWDIIGLP